MRALPPRRVGVRTVAAFAHVAAASAALLLAAALLGAAAPALASAPRSKPPLAGAAAAGSPDAEAWTRIQKLIDDQKFEAAATETARVRDLARARGDDAGYTRALIQEVQLRSALHGYETAVKLLQSSPWPKKPLWRTALHLFQARQLVLYFRTYAREISQREAIAAAPADAKGPPADLKAWTRDDIFAAVQREYRAVWSMREALGREPSSALAGYLEPNDYPKGIRGTLRDAITYLWVDQLADTSQWRPDHLNESWSLDPKALVAGDPETSAKVALDDPAVHPLLKLGAVLDDLESWHARQNEPEASLEARLERARRLHAALRAPEDQRLLVDDLTRRLAAFPAALPWRAMGLAALAELIQDSDAPDALVRARAIALEGLKAFPESPGGQRCRHVVAAIEAPGFELQGMATDAPDKRSLQVRHKNLPALWMRAYPLDLEGHLAEARNSASLVPDAEEMRRAVEAGTPPLREWKVALPATADFRFHRTFVVPPLHDAGGYLLVASARPDFKAAGNQLVGLAFFVSDLVLISRPAAAARGTQLTVVSGSTGRPVSEVRIDSYRFTWGSGFAPAGSLTTDDDGMALLQPEEKPGPVFIVARKGNDLAVEPDPIGLSYDDQPSEGRATFVYTDRSAYRPQQKVLWKVVAYRGDPREAAYEALADEKLEVVLYDANHQPVERRAVKTNEYGSAAGEFTLPSGRMLGGWSIGTRGGFAAIRVEEYKRPTFEVTLLDPSSPLRVNAPARLTGEARYYFGLPVASGTARWRVTRTPIFPLRWSDRRVGGGLSFINPPAAERPEVIASGSAPLDADGRFALAFTPRADPRDEGSGLTYRFTLDADVTDEGGETRSAARTVRLGWVGIEAALTAATEFFETGAPARLTATRRDLDGTPRPGRASWRLVALRQPERALLPADMPADDAPAGGAAAYATEGDRLRPRFDPDYAPDAVMRGWEDGSEQARGELTHDARGETQLALPPLHPGAYRVRYRTSDDAGKVFETAKEFVIAGPHLALALPALLLAEQTTVSADGGARLLVHSGLPDQPLLLEVYQSGREIAHRWLEPSRPSPLVEVPLGPERRGGIVVELVAVRDHQRIAVQQRVFVPFDDRALRVELSTFRDRLRPRAHESWRVTVRDAKGEALEAGAAELLAYMYDRSLDLIAPHTPPQPLDVYPHRDWAAALRLNLRAAYTQWIDGSDFAPVPSYPVFNEDRLVNLDGYGIGGLGRGARGGMVPPATTMYSLAVPAPNAPGAPPEAAREAGAAAERNAASAAAHPRDEGLRQDFTETAFWRPQLLLGSDGSAAIEFDVPDSVTAWSVWVHALARDLRAGSVQREARSLKELMVRPYLPRFLREGDAATVDVVLNNASDAAVEGTVDLDLVDPDSGASVAAEFGLRPEQTRGVRFSAPKGGSARLPFALTAPARVGAVAVRVQGRAGNYSDGEQRVLPLLPSRVHLMQSRFAALKERGARTLAFPDLAKAKEDPTRIDEALVVTVDGQLFSGVLAALPYLVNYPYECTEQTLNRFVSTGVLTRVYRSFPSLAKQLDALSKRTTPLEPFDAADPNRKLAFEETPWLVAARGGGSSGGDAGLPAINLLDARAAEAERAAALGRLRKAQLPDGSFPWFPGGPGSPHMTLYILYGFAKAAEFGVEVPREVVERGWSWLANHYQVDYAAKAMREDRGWEFLTFLNYVASSYPDPSWMGGALGAADRQQILEFSLKHWRQHSPYLKAQLALTLKRMGRAADAKRVFDSVMDSAKTTPDEGTFWQPEDEAWLWYRDTVETHAFALRALSELEPKDPRRAGLVQWLFLNKQLNHWKSTRATAEAIYALAHYLKAEGQLGAREQATVRVGPRSETFSFDPDDVAAPSSASAATCTAPGREARLVVPGPAIDPATMASVVVEKQTPGLLFASATWQYSTERLPTESRGDLLAVSRRYFKREMRGTAAVLQPLTDGAAIARGDEVEVQLTMRARHPAEYVHLRDPRAAGFEPVRQTSGFRWDLAGVGYYEEVRDSATNFFIEQLPAGEYTLKYRLRAATAGTFRVGPATLQSMYAPEFGAFSSGASVQVAP